MQKTDIAPVEALKKVLAEIEEKVVLNYTLADALREGSTVTEQKFNGYISGGEACALGAAYISAKARGYI